MAYRKRLLSFIQFPDRNKAFPRIYYLTKGGAFPRLIRCDEEKFSTGLG